MEKKEGLLKGIGNALGIIFSSTEGFKTKQERENFEKELAKIQKIEEQVKAEKENFGASLRVYNKSNGARKGQTIKKESKNQAKKQEIERGE